MMRWLVLDSQTKQGPKLCCAALVLLLLGEMQNIAFISLSKIIWMPKWRNWTYCPPPSWKYAQHRAGNLKFEVCNFPAGAIMAYWACRHDGTCVVKAATGTVIAGFAMFRTSPPHWYFQVFFCIWFQPYTHWILSFSKNFSVHAKFGRIWGVSRSPLKMPIPLFVISPRSPFS